MRNFAAGRVKIPTEPVVSVLPVLLSDCRQRRRPVIKTSYGLRRSRWAIFTDLPGDYVACRAGFRYLGLKSLKSPPGGILLTIIGISIVGLPFILTSIFRHFRRCLRRSMKTATHRSARILWAR
ncbi:hypothetical protein KCP70_13625 [Salmonella enterica subsp. enterica]|nr:hypothetical protein KCP70_13625 [Salmonella enterica subsp. enterica]